MNDQILELLDGDYTTYLSDDSDETKDDDERINLTIELLNSINPSRMSQHWFRLKVGSVVMLLRNLNTKKVLCNGTKLVISTMRSNVIQAKMYSTVKNGTVPMPSTSHHVVFQTIYKELSLRGHHMTVITPIPLNDPTLTNLTEIDVSEPVKKIFEEINFIHFMNKEFPISMKLRKAFELSYEVSEAILSDKRFIDVYNNSASKFDLVLMQSFFSPILYSVAAKLKAPLVGVSSFGAWIGIHQAMGNLSPLSSFRYLLQCTMRLFQILIHVCTIVESANILSVFQATSFSHQLVFHTIYKELSLRGHHVTVVTPRPLDDPTLTNLTEIDVSEVINRIYKKIDVANFMGTGLSNYVKVRRAFRLSYEVSEAIFSDKRFIDVYNNSASKFDVVLVQSFFSPILYPVATKLNAPLVGVSSMGAWIGTHQAMGNPSPLSVFSDLFSPYYSRRLRLSEKLANTVYYIWSRNSPTVDNVLRALLL
nr:unnamed protein product [Callosobruchus analis]